MIPLSKRLGPAISAPAPVQVAAWDGVGIRPSFGVNKQLPIEETDDTVIQNDDTLAGLVAKAKGLNRGVEAADRLGTISYHQAQNEFLF